MDGCENHQIGRLHQNQQVQIKIQGVQVHIDLFLLPMAGSNIVTGTQWLKDLGDVVSNYKDLVMKFKWKGKQVCWNVISWVSSDLLTSGQLKSLHASSSEVYLCYFEMSEGNSEER